MPFPFTKKPPPPKKPRKSHLPQTLDAALEKELIRRARRDPEWAFAAAKQKFNIFGPEDEDPIEKIQKQALADALENDPEFLEQVKQQYLLEHGGSQDGTENSIARRISEAAFEELEKNPELLMSAARKQIMGAISEYSPTSGVSELLGQLRELREAEDEIGGGRGNGKMLGGLVDSSTITEVIKLIPTLLGKSISSPPSGTYIVETPSGEIFHLTREQFAQRQHQRSLPQASPKEAPPEVESENSVDLVDLVDLVDSVESESITDLEPVPLTSKIETWLPYLDQDPQYFVSALQDLVEQEDQTSIWVLNFLLTRTSEEVLSALQPYREKEDVGSAIYKLEEHSEWLEQVIALLQKFYERTT